MSNIRLDLSSPVINGQTVTFKSPIDCSEVTGIKVYYPNGNSTTSKTFQFADAHGNDVSHIGLFAENVLVQVILDTENSRAYVQNADTNEYLEAKFKTKADKEQTYWKSSVKNTNLTAPMFWNIAQPTFNSTKDGETCLFVFDLFGDGFLGKLFVVLEKYVVIGPTFDDHEAVIEEGVEVKSAWFEGIGTPEIFITTTSTTTVAIYVQVSPNSYTYLSKAISTSTKGHILYNGHTTLQTRDYVSSGKQVSMTWGTELPENGVAGQQFILLE